MAFPETTNTVPTIPLGWQGSTALDPAIVSYSDLVYRTKSMLGWPISPVELTDSQFANIIDNACEIYQNWEGNRKEEYLVFCSNVYKRGCGVKLDELLQVGCNKQFCHETTVVESVTSWELACDIIDTKTAYLSVSPFTYPYTVNYKTRFETIVPEFTGQQGQYIHIYFDPKNPWKAQNVCNANCLEIRPVSSQWFQLSSNPNLSATVFDFINDTTISSIASSISSNWNYTLSAVPLSGMGSSLSAIPLSFFNLSAFYPPNELIGPSVEGCINIGQGAGFVYPNCDTSLIFPCSGLENQWNISPSWNYVLTSQLISSVTVASTAINFSTISSYFNDYCDTCLCNCSALSSFNETLSTYYFEVNSPVLSGDDGRIVPLSARNISSATHVRLSDIPSCTDDGSIPLISNDGITGSFVLCNSAFSTSGPMGLENIQFFKDYKPPTEVLDWYCGINNNGFTMSYYNSAYDNCIRPTPVKTKVDVAFCRQNLTTHIGEVSTTHISNYDEGFGKSRKVLGVFDVETSSQGGYGGAGGDLLYNFDYALMAGSLGYDLQGSRSMIGKQGYDLTTYHLAKSFVEQSRKMLRYTSYTFDPNTQYLKLTPEPGISSSMFNSIGDTGCSTDDYARGGQCYLIGVYLSPTVQEMLGTYWVQEYVLAKSKAVLGEIRSQFSNVTLYGNVSLEGSAMKSEGYARITELMKELRQDNYYSSNSLFFMG